MKKINLLVIALIGLLVVSCSKSKEDKFLSDIEDFVEECEKMSKKELPEKGAILADQLESRVKGSYGVELKLGNSTIAECAEKGGLVLNEKQKEKADELDSRLIKIAQKAQEGDSSDESWDDDDEKESSSNDSDDSDYTSSSEDWDSLLDSYEEYVDEYISYVKKAAKGDMDALSEYPALMEKAQEFSDKMKDAQGEMSSSQWGRYMKITTKMSQAAMELQ